MNNMRIITGLHVFLVNRISKLWFFIFALAQYKSLATAMRTMKKLRELKRDISGGLKIQRMVKANGRYYWNMHIPGFPGQGFNTHLLGELNRINSVAKAAPRLNILFLTITKKCQFACRHCYAHHEMDHKEDLSLERLMEIGEAFVRSGVTHIHLGGGEPMMRYDDMVTFVRKFGKRAEIWIASNGFNISDGQAAELKAAGLTGVAISIDHYAAEEHNSFRGHPKSFEHALQSTVKCRDAGLVTCWSVCITREFANKEKLLKYAALAERMKVPWIQFFEVMPAGRYLGADVCLNEVQKKILEEVCIEVNTLKKYRNFPIIEYIGIYQKKTGCLGAGNRYVYVDTNGNLQPCPFCLTEEKIPVDAGDIEGCLEKIGQWGCKLNSQLVGH